MSSLASVACKRTLWQVFIRVYRLGPSFVNCCPSSLLSGSTLPSPPSLCQSTAYTDSVWLRGGGGSWVLLEAIFQRSLALCIWPDSEPTKLPHHAKQKLKRGGDLRQINTWRKVPLKVNFFRRRHCQYSHLVHGWNHDDLFCGWNRKRITLMLRL